MRRWWLAVVLSGCALGSGVSAEESLTLRAIAGEEEAAADDGFVPPDGPGLPLFRACDADGEYVGLFSAADADGSGALEAPESDDVTGSYGPPPPFWPMLLAVYDADDSGDVGEGERVELLADFTIRCEVLHERLLADFDADGDGALSEAEQQDAIDALPEPPGPPPMGGPPMGGPPQPGELPPPLVAEYDADGSGDLDATELATFREEARERIRSGAPLLPPPPAE